MGRKSPAADGSYASFTKALHKSDAALARQLEFRFVDVESRIGHDPRKSLLQAMSPKPALLVAPNGEFAKLAAYNVADVPILFASYVQPVQAGIVKSMLKRSEAITGIWISEHLDGKRLEILRDAYPDVRTVGVLMDASWRQLADRLAPVELAARELGLTARIFVAETPEAVEEVLDHPDARGLDAWILPRSYVAVLATPMVVNRMRQWHKPLIVGNTADVLAGAPLSYATDTRFIWPTLASLSRRILTGEAAGQIAIQRPQRYVLAVRTGPETGLPPPSAAIVRMADVVLR